MSVVLESESVMCGESSSSLFNASITVTELLSKTLENMVKDFAARCIHECALRHGFDESVEIRALGLENLALIRKQMAKKPKGEKKSKKEPKEPKEPKSKKEKSFPLPFMGSEVDLLLCNGLSYNHGLFTQCPKKTMEDSLYCKKCQEEADNSASGKPICGTVQDRLACGLYEFKDSKGRSPVSYLKVLEKAKKTQSEALEVADKLGLVIAADHWKVQEKAKKSKGRPKKASGAVEASDVTDLFAKLTAEDGEPVVIESAQPPKAKKGGLTDEEKAAKKAALEAEREHKKAEKAAQLAAEKAAKEAKRLEEKAAKEAKALAEKAEREAKRQQEKAEREAKKAAEKAAKEAAKTSKSKKSDAVAVAVAVAPAVAPDAAPAVAPAAAPAAPAADEDAITVTKIKIGGVMYLKSKDNMLYNMDSEEVGIWDPVAKKILPLPTEVDDEVADEEYEEY